MQLPVENYILSNFILMEILFNITKRLVFSKISPRPQGKNNP